MGDDVSSGSVEVRLLGDALEVKGLNNLCELVVCVSVDDRRAMRGSSARVAQFVSPVMVLVDRTWSIEFTGCLESS